MEHYFGKVGVSGGKWGIILGGGGGGGHFFGGVGMSAGEWGGCTL